MTDSFFDNILSNDSEKDKSEPVPNIGDKRLRDDDDDVEHLLDLTDDKRFKKDVSNIQIDLISKLKKLREEYSNLNEQKNKLQINLEKKLATAEEKLDTVEEKLTTSEEKLNLFQKLFENFEITTEISNNLNCVNLMKIFVNIVNNCNISNSLKFINEIDFADNSNIENLTKLIKTTDSKSIEILIKNGVSNIKKQLEVIEKSNKFNYKNVIVNTIFKCDFDNILLVKWDDNLVSMVVVCNECNEVYPSSLNVFGCLKNQYNQTLYYALNDPSKIIVLSSSNLLELLNQLFEENNLKNFKSAVNSQLFPSQFKKEVWKHTSYHIKNNNSLYNVQVEQILSEFKKENIN